MKKNTILIIVLVTLLIILFGAYAISTMHNHDNKVKVGEVLFNLPEGFEQISSENNKTTLKNTTSSIGILYYNDNNITKYVDQYTSQNDPESINTSQFTVDNLTIYKSIIINDTRYIHYWFVDNDKVYTIYTWEGNNDTDSIVSKLITNRELVN